MPQSSASASHAAATGASAGGLALERPLRLLLIDDSPADAQLLLEHLRQSKLNYELEWKDTLTAGRQWLSSESVDVLLLDLNLPGSQGLETFEKVRGEHPRLAVVILTGLDDEALALEAVRGGAHDFLPKGGVSPDALSRSIRYAVERQRAETDLAEARGVLDSMFENLDEVFFAFDRTTQRLVQVSPAAERVLGRSASEIATDPSALLDMVHADDRDAAQAAVGASLRGESVHTELRFIHPDGGVRWLLLKSKSAGSAHGADSGIHGLISDVTERREAEDARRLSYEQSMEIQHLRDVTRFKTRLLNMASHELNTPLTPLQLQLQMLQQQRFGPLTEDQQRAVRVLDRNLQRLAGLVSDILDVARLESGHLTIQREDADIAKIVAEAVEAYVDMAEDRHVALEIRSADAVPVEADARRLTQVVINLISNALKFTPAGGIVRVTLSTEKTVAVVAVRDSGPGIAPDQHSLLFQPFSQTTNEPVETGLRGSGLGLYICKGIVEQHGGRIWLESDGQGEGATFLFSVPLIASKPPAAANTTPDAAAAQHEA